MTRWKSAMALSLAALLAAPVLWWAWPDNQAPDVTFVLLDGRKLHTTQLHGKPALISFWATSCPSCLQEIPDLVALQREYGRSGVTIIGVAMPYDPPNLVVDFARQRQLPYAIALDLDARLVHAFGDIQVTPTNILVGPSGRILERRVGKLDLQQTRRRIAQLLEEG